MPQGDSATPSSEADPLLPLRNNMPIIVHPEDTPYRINPNYPGHVLHFLFASEVFLNIIEAIFLVFFPNRVLHVLLAEGVPRSASLGTLMQFFGMLYVGITVVTALGLPNTPTAIETRKSVYRMYAVLDLIAVTWLNILAIKGPSYSGFAPKPMFVVGNLLTGALLLRVVSLVWFPSAFGRYEYVLDDKRTL
jgi:hypothetical protein